jgi:long-subunit fatty acid transport protein
MKKFLLTSSVLICCYSVIAQLPEDILRYSFYPQRGSARILAVGGAMGSLGGDISALYANPAGLGFYKTSEIVFTPGAVLNNNKFNYRGTQAASNKEGFNLGTTGLVFGFNTPGSKWTNQAFSIGLNETANFNNVLSYRGQNSLSSYTEVFAEEASRSNKSIDGIIDDPRYAFGTAPALYTYLVDTFRNSSGGYDVRGLPEFLLDQGIALNQEKRISTTGGIHEVAFGYATNMDDRLYLGASVGIPIVNYKRNTVYRESDPTGNKTNRFNYFQLEDNLSTKGAGVNVKLGLIYKPSEFVRLGLSLHSPTYYSLTDRQSSNMLTDVENARSVQQEYPAPSSLFITGGEGVTKYTSTSPWKAVVSGSYVFREIVDTRKQRAFLTADMEYTGYPSASFKEDSENGGGDNAYYTELKSVIKESYKGAFNFRLGGEVKFHTWMFRAGTAYYGNPYKDNANLKADRFVASGGLGYRNYGMFIDLTYAHAFNHDVNFPYRLSDKANTFAQQTGGAGNLMLTLGFKL